MIESGIEEEQLFILIERAMSFSRLGYIDLNDESVTLKDVFEKAWENPLAAQLKDVGSSLVDAIQSSDFGGALASIGSQTAEMLKAKSDQMLDRLDDMLDMDVDGLIPAEATTYRTIQTFLMTNGTLMSWDQERAIDKRILTVHPEFNEHPKAVALAREFHQKLQSKTNPLLQRAYERFDIEDSDGKNYLRMGVTYENLRFFSAAELVLLADALEGKPDQAADLALLGILLKSFDDVWLRERFVYFLGRELSKDVPDIKVPGLKTIKPYVGDLLAAAGKHIGLKLLDFFHRASPMATEHATAQSSEEMADKFKSGGVTEYIVALGEEAGGTALELTADAFAAIALTLGIEDELASCETGKEILDLIRLNGGHISSYRDRDGAAAILIHIGSEIFVARPLGMMEQIVESMIEGEPGGALKIFVGGSSFFVAKGFLHGVFKTARTVDGRAVLA